MWPLELGLGTHNPRFVVWPLELGSGTRNPRFVTWPLELGLGTLNPLFVAWPLELGLGTRNPLLGNDWRRQLHVKVPSLSPQPFEFEARHFKDLTTESYVTDCAQIVVYYWWASQTALSADWDTMGVVWVVRDSLRNASCASAQRQKQLVGSWAQRTLEASSIDMSFAPPLIVAQVCNMSNWHWVLCLLLIAPTHKYLCLKFD